MKNSELFDADSFCESPIEIKLINAYLDSLQFVSVCNEYTKLSSIPESVEHTKLHPEQVDFVFPQHQIESYRVDFLFCRYVTIATPANLPTKLLLQRLPLIVIECDGHDFHNITPDQAGRDRSRDRALNALGYRVLRFTGREIHRKPDKCIQDIEDVFDSFEFPDSYRI